MKKDLVIFIPGYCLSSQVLYNYSRQFGQRDILFFDYYDCKNEHEIREKFDKLTSTWKESKWIIVCQSLGFKIFTQFIDRPNIDRIISFNPLFGAPRKTFLGKRAQNMIIKAIFNFLKSPVGKSMFKKTTTINQFILSRKLLGIRSYKSLRLFRNFVYMNSDMNIFYSFVVNSMQYMIEKELLNKYNDIKMDFLIGSHDRLLFKDFEGPYFQNLIKQYPNVCVHNLPGGHEGFLEHEEEWIAYFNKLIVN